MPRGGERDIGLREACENVAVMELFSGTCPSIIPAQLYGELIMLFFLDIF